MTASAAAMTVGDANAKSLVPRAVMWALAVYLPCMFIAGTAAVSYCIYTSDSTFPVPWWLLAGFIMAWGAYMAAVSEVMMCMHLFLPAAPLAVRQALVDVGMCWIGLPLSWMAVLVPVFGPLWMAVALACLMLALIAAVVAFWVWLARTYR